MGDFDTQDLTRNYRQPQRSRRTLDFNGRRYSTPFALAQALCQNPQAAVAVLDGRAVQHLASTAETLVSDDLVTQILRRCATKELSAWRAHVELQLAVFRRADILVDGRRITAASWVDVLQDASAGEDSGAQKWVWQCVEDDVLTPVLDWIPESDVRFRSWSRFPAAEASIQREVAALAAKPDLGVKMPDSQWLRASLLAALVSLDAERQAIVECQKMLRWYSEHVTSPCPVFKAECEAALAGGLTVERATVLNLVCRTSHGAQREFELKEQSLADTLKRASAARTEAEQDKWSAECLAYARMLTTSWLRWQGGFAATGTLFVWLVDRTPNSAVFQMILSPVLCAAVIYGLAWLLVRRAPRRLNELHDEYIPLVATLYLLGVLIGFVVFVIGGAGGFPWWLPAVAGLVVPLRLIWRGLGKAPVVHVKLSEQDGKGAD